MPTPVLPLATSCRLHNGRCSVISPGRRHQLIIWSIRRSADHRLRKGRGRARRGGGDRPPWPTGLGRLLRPLTSYHRTAVLSIGLAACVLALCVISLAVPSSVGIPAATTDFLSQLWQAQAVVSGLAFALAVFVFGLLPEARGRATYGEFLRHSGTLPLVTAGIGSLIFDGLVLLGVGHQIRASGSTAGHGWAVTVAAIAGIVSSASIVMLLGRTITAIDTATSQTAQSDYRRRAVGQAVRAELRERACLLAMLDPKTPGEDVFSLVRPEAGLSIRARGKADRVVRDVSPRRLALLTRRATSKGRTPPVLGVWPGKIITAATPLITIDGASGAVARWWARHSVQLGAAPADLLGVVLDMSHAETMKHIRAGRPVEANAGMQVMAELHEPMWQAYAAYGMRYGTDLSRSFWLYMPTAGERILATLDAQVRAAAVSGDEQIRRAAIRWPYLIARNALARKAAGSVDLSLGLLPRAYGSPANCLMAADCRCRRQGSAGAP